MDEKITEYKKKLEAILFAVGRKLSFEELVRLTRIRNTEGLKEALYSLKDDYEKKEGSLMIELISEGDQEFWKFTVKRDMIPLIKKIVSKTELPKSIIETLAYIAYKYPIKQSDLVKVRSNKAYDHLKELENAGYISRQRYGRTKVIKLTDKFFDYFDLPPDKVKEHFKDFEALEKAIEEKEMEVNKIKEEHRLKREEMNKVVKEDKKEDESLEPDLDQIEIDLIDKEGHKTKLNVYEQNPIPEDAIREIDIEPEITEVEDKLGELDIIDEPIEELSEQMEKKKEPEHIGDLDIYEEKKKDDVESDEDAEDTDESEDDLDEPSESEDESTDESEEEVKEPIFAPEEEVVPDEPKEVTIDDEIQDQKEHLKPQKDAKLGDGFEKSVDAYMSEKAEVRADEMMHPTKEVKKAEGEEDEQEKPLIDMPEEHVKEDLSEEEMAKESEQEESVEKEDDKILVEEKKVKRSKKDVELPPMDDFNESEKDDIEKK